MDCREIKNTWGTLGAAANLMLSEAPASLGKEYGDLLPIGEYRKLTKEEGELMKNFATLKLSHYIRPVNRILVERFCELVDQLTN